MVKLYESTHYIYTSEKEALYAASNYTGIPANEFKGEVIKAPEKKVCLKRKQEHSIVGMSMRTLIQTSNLMLQMRQYILIWEERGFW